MHFPGPQGAAEENRKPPFQRQGVRKVKTPDSVHRRADRVARQVVAIYEHLQDVREALEDLFDLEIAQGGLTWDEHERRVTFEQQRTCLVEELASLRDQIAGQRSF